MAKLAATTYGDALFQLALEESKIDALYDEVLVVLKAFEDNSELNKLLNHPKIDKEEKEKFLENVFGNFVSKNLTGFLMIMVSKDRQQNIVEALYYFCDKVLLCRGWAKPFGCWVDIYTFLCDPVVLFYSS